MTSVERYRRLTTVLLTALVSVASAWAEQPIGSEFRVNTYTTSLQGVSDVTSAANGSFVVVWHSYGQDGSGFGIFGQRHDSLGQRVGGEFQVNTFTPQSQTTPAIASADDGSFVVVWESLDGSFYGVFGQRFDASGAPVGSELQVNTSTYLQQVQPDVAVSDDGDFTVVWFSEHNQANRWEVMGQRYDGSGNPVGGEFQISSATTISDFDPAISYLPDGFAVVWAKGSSSDIMGRLYDASGSPIGGEFLVNTATTGTQSTPAIAADEDGDFVVVWESGNLSGTGIYGRRFDSSGEPLGEEFQASSTSSLFHSTVSVGSAPEGAFAVLWSNWGQDGDQWGIFGQRYDASAERVGGEFQVNTFTTGSQRWSSVEPTADGEFVFSWSSDHQAASLDDVFAQIWSGTGPILRATGTCPGVVTVTLSSFQPRSEVAVVAAANTNGFVKGGKVCPGTELTIGEPFQLPPTFVVVDDQGVSGIQLDVGADRCYLQAFSVEVCDPTNVVQLPAPGQPTD